MGKQPKADLNDIAILAGFGALVAGLWILSPAAALIVGGLMLMVAGLYGSWLKAAERARKRGAGGGE